MKGYQISALSLKASSERELLNLFMIFCTLYAKHPMNGLIPVAIIGGAETNKGEENIISFSNSL